MANVPAEAGLYAWYLKPELRAADLHDKAATEENIRRLAEQLRIPELRVGADGHLSLQLAGQLDHVHLGHRAQDGFSELIKRVLTDQDTRTLFAEILRHTRPYLMAPLYIGVATNLRERLAQHRSAIESDVYTAAYPHAHTFGREVRARGIPARSLFVHVLSVAALCAPSVPKETQREVAEAVETLLNRLYYPILGRR